MTYNMKGCQRLENTYTKILCVYRSRNQSELRGLEVKTISVNEAEQSAKIKSVKKQ